MFSTHPDFRIPDALMEEHNNRILSRMTLEEKIDLLGGCKVWGEEAGNTRSCSRMGIPSLRMADASVGIHWWIQDTTAFPASIALAASFDTDLAAEYATAIARDCRAGGIHILLGPGLNLYRSPLCGRNFEYFGEDPCLASRMTVSFVQALQAQGVAATLKHYAVNYQEFDRNKVSSDVDERTLREVYLAAFEAGVKEGGAAAVMTGYNLVNGQHCAEHGFLIRDVLKGEWGFEGIVMSDWVSVYDALNSATAGLDLEMPWAQWMNREHLVPAVRDGRLPLEVIDDKVRRLLRLTSAFGWNTREQLLHTPDRNLLNAATALKVAQESMVLLKNDNLLPLDFGRIANMAVIGPNSDPAVIGGGGSAYTEGWRSVSFLQGIAQELKGRNVHLRHARGIDNSIAPETFEAGGFFQADGAVGVEASYYNSNDLSGDPVLVRMEKLINNRWNERDIAPGVDKKNFSIRYRAKILCSQSGPVDFYLHVWDGAARLLVDGVAIHDTWNKEAFGLHHVACPLEAGPHDVVLEFRNIRGWNSICMGWDAENRKSREYQKALDCADWADVVVYCGGFNRDSEAEGSDRSFAMPAQHEKLLLEVARRNPRVLVVLTAGGNVDMEAWHDKVAGIIHAWYPGQEGGTALADIITGKVNPSGRLPATFEYRLEDRSSAGCYHDTDGDLRVELTDGVFGGYRHCDRSGIQPRYPFGYGLSYTTFAYQNLELSTPVLESGADLEVSFELTNTGSRGGAEVAQLYVGQDHPSVPRPVRELKGIAKCHLEPGESRRIRFVLKARDFSWYSMERKEWVCEPGSFTLYVAASAADLRLSATCVIK